MDSYTVVVLWSRTNWMKPEPKTEEKEGKKRQNHNLD